MMGLEDHMQNYRDTAGNIKGTLASISAMNIKGAAKFDVWQITAEFVKITYWVWFSAMATAAFNGSPDGRY